MIRGGTGREMLFLGGVAVPVAWGRTLSGICPVASWSVSELHPACSLRSRRGLVQEDKRMAFVYTHGLFIT
jgi:hypothetical protein